MHIKHARNSPNIGPLVSIIIPTYNRAHYLYKTIESVINQTYSNLEIIIIDDGSTDETKSVVDKFCDKRLKYFFQKNSGVSVARNNGIRRATGEYIMFLDSDDTILPTKIEEQVKFMETHPDIDCVYCWWQYIDAAGSLLGEGCATYRGNILEKIIEWNFAPIHSYLFRYKCFRNISGFKRGIEGVEDWDLLIRFAAKGYIFDFIPKILVQYRMHQKNITNEIDTILKNQIHMLNENFSCLDLPESIKKKGSYTYFLVYIHACSLYYRNGQYEKASKHFSEAIRIYPNGLISEAFFNMIIDCLAPADWGVYTQIADIKDKIYQVVDIYNFFINSIDNSILPKKLISNSRENFYRYLKEISSEVIECSP